MKKNLGLLFEITRKALGLSQLDVAGTVKIDRSAISHFEAGRATISSDKLHDMASLLHINPDYIDGKSEIPFKSDDLIKFYVKGLIPELEALYILILYNQQLELISLIPPMNILERLKTLPSFRTLAALFDTHTLFGLMIYAVAARDAENNIFLVRHKNPNEFLIWGKQDLKSLVSNTIIATGKNPEKIVFTRQEITRELYEKIRSWNNIKRKDIEPLFTKQSREEYVNLSTDEKDLIELIRGKKLDPKRIARSLPQGGKSES